CGPQGDLGAALLCTPDGRTMISTTRFSLDRPVDSYRVGLSVLAMPSVLCTGDFTGDRLVNTDDLIFLLGGFGHGVEPRTGGDMTGDGVVNTVDLASFLGAFGSAC
ncbi:MAG: GC-type dockerin domain-anchored protein, partial [Phycisphaerales bacterium]